MMIVDIDILSSCRDLGAHGRWHPRSYDDVGTRSFISRAVGRRCDLGPPCRRFACLHVGGTTLAVSLASPTIRLNTSSRHPKERDLSRAMRAFAESEAQSNSDSDDGLDIVKSSRQTLQLSQYIDGQRCCRVREIYQR